MIDLVNARLKAAALGGVITFICAACASTSGLHIPSSGSAGGGSTDSGPIDDGPADGGSTTTSAGPLASTLSATTDTGGGLVSTGGGLVDTLGGQISTLGAQTNLPGGGLIETAGGPISTAGQTVAGLGGGVLDQGLNGLPVVGGALNTIASTGDGALAPVIATNVLNQGGGAGPRPQRAVSATGNRLRS